MVRKKSDHKSVFNYERKPNVGFKSPLFIIVLLVLLIFVVIAALIIVKPFGAVRLGNISFDWLPTSNLLKGKNSSSKPFAYTIHLTNRDFDEIFRQMTVPNIENISTSIHPNQIEIKGNTTTVIKASVMVAFVPKVDSSGNITLDIKDATVAGIRVMPIVTDEARQKISKAISDYVGQKFSGKITDINLKEGELEAKVVPNS